MPRPLALLISLLLGAGCAALISCGSDEDTVGIPPEAASGMLDELEIASVAREDGDCTEIQESSQDIQAAAAALPETVDAELRTAISEGAVNLGELATTQCEETETTTEDTDKPETTETEPTETTETTAPTTTEETTTTTTEEAPEEDEEGEDGGQPPGQPPGPPEDVGPDTGGTGDGRDAKDDKRPKDKRDKD